MEAVDIRGWVSMFACGVCHQSRVLPHRESVVGILIGTALWTHLFDGKYLSYCPGLDTSISYLVEFIILHNQTQWDERQRHEESKCQEAVHGLLVGAINSITRWRAGWASRQASS